MWKLLIFHIVCSTIRKDNLVGGAEMAKKNVTMSLDEGIKEESDKLFEELGISFSAAINIFLRQSLREGKIPFEFSTNTERGDK